MANTSWLKAQVCGYDVLSLKHCSVTAEQCDFLTMRIWFLQKLVWKQGASPPPPPAHNTTLSEQVYLSQSALEGLLSGGDLPTPTLTKTVGEQPRSKDTVSLRRAGREMTS